MIGRLVSFLSKRHYGAPSSCEIASLHFISVLLLVRSCTHLVDITDSLKDESNVSCLGSK